MATISETTSKAPETDGKDSGKTASRTALAAGFAYIGLKFGTIGTIIDANKAFKGEQLTAWEKIKEVFSLRLVKRLWNQVKQEHPDSYLGRAKSAARILKYSIIFNAAGVIAGATLGWVRGDRIEDPTDLLVHPIKSLKAAFGPKPVSQTQDASLEAKNEPVPEPANEAGKTKVWTQAVSQPSQLTEAAQLR